MSLLFEPLTLRSLTIKNRAWIPPMCQYSADAEGPETGAPNDWRFQHLASRAVGGAGLIVVEATAVSPEGRITPWDLGLWNDRQAEAFRRVTRFLLDQGAVPAIQLAHAGRKASTDRPWLGGAPLAAENPLAWTPVGPSPLPFDDRSPVPHELTTQQIAEVVQQFADAARRALAAGFQVVEVHAAHGYLVHEFLSPHSNQRTDAYGGSRQNRMRLALEIADAVRAAWPDELPLFFRLSATDWTADGGWTPEDSVQLAKELAARGVDLVDTSTAGNTPTAQIPVGPGYQVPFAAQIRRDAGIPTAAVGLITEPDQAERILADGDADAVLLGRAALRDPYWPHHAARALGVTTPRPPQYHRA